MTARPPVPLWTMAELAGLLSVLGPASRVVTALPPTADARLRRMIGNGLTRPRVIGVSPDWTLAAMTSERWPVLCRLDPHDGLVPLGGPMAGRSSLDRNVVRQPLAALFGDHEGSLRMVRVRTLDDLFGGLVSCEAVVVGSGMPGVDLLVTAADLLARNVPLVAVDLAREAWLDPVPDGTEDAVRAALPSHMALPPGHGGAAAARFLVMVPRGAMLPTPLSPGAVAPTGVPVLGWDACALLVADGNWLREPRRIAWNGRAPGLTLLLDQPGESRGLRLSILSASRHGLNVFVNGRRVRPLQPIPAAGELTWIDVPARPELGRDRLLTVMLAPVRPTTTTRPERLEIAGIAFV